MSDDEARDPEGRARGTGPSSIEKEARRKILARRAAFVAVALAGVSTVACETHPAEHPRAPMDGDASAPPPQATQSSTTTDRADASAAPAPTTSGTAMAPGPPPVGVPPTTPSICLSVVPDEEDAQPPKKPKPPPRPCLKIAPRK
jgi:hypothetical protein